MTPTPPDRYYVTVETYDGADTHVFATWGEVVAFLVDFQRHTPPGTDGYHGPTIVRGVEIDPQTGEPK